MCLGGGGGDSYEPRYLQRNTAPQAGPGAPPDTVNQMIVSDKGDYSQESAKTNKSKLTTPKAQSSKNTGLY